MNQKEFTDYVIPKLKEALPQAKEYIIDEHVDVCYLEFPSPQGKLKVLISTRDAQLTIGFGVGPGLFDWHDHLSPIAADENIKDALAIISEIINGKTGIIHSSVLGYFPGDPEDMEDVEKFRDENEVIEYLYWKDL
ncbi:MAG: hypothetical protein JST68_01240 [Bacteroidetes bacterium]|nr:hypothetical protein [Bacteroidota bacterium]